MKLWYTNNSAFTSYTTVTPHSDFRSAYVTSHVQYTYALRIHVCANDLAPRVCPRMSNPRMSNPIMSNEMQYCPKMSNALIN